MVIMAAKCKKKKQTKKTKAVKCWSGANSYIFAITSLMELVDAYLIDNFPL